MLSSTRNVVFEFDVLFWAQLSLSLFNAILLIWLGLTVLVNAERRSLGVWIASIGMTIGGVFFLGHGAMLYYNLRSLVVGIATWWYGGWVALIGLPSAWFGLMLWYAGFWDDDRSALHRRQRPWLALVLFTAIAMTLLLILTDPRYVLRNVALVALSSPSSDNRVLALSIVYPLYLLACICLSLDALRRPAPSGAFDGRSGTTARATLASVYDALAVGRQPTGGDWPFVDRFACVARRHGSICGWLWWGYVELRFLGRRDLRAD
jgi:hypothetical protein